MWKSHIYRPTPCIYTHLSTYWDALRATQPSLIKEQDIKGCWEIARDDLQGRIREIKTNKKS